MKPLSSLKNTRLGKVKRMVIRPLQSIKGKRGFTTHASRGPVPGAVTGSANTPDAAITHPDQNAMADHVAQAFPPTPDDGDGDDDSED